MACNPGSRAAVPRRGVWEGDAAPGQVALIVVTERGERIARLEVAERYYSAWWVRLLERWLARVDRARLQIVRAGAR